MDTGFIICLIVGLGLFVLDMVLLHGSRNHNSITDLMIPVLVDENFRTPEKQKALRRAELMKRGAIVRILFAGRSRIGIVHRAEKGQRAIIMATNRHGKLFRVYRHLDKLMPAA